MIEATPDPASVIIDLEQRLASAWVKRDRPFIEAALSAEWTVTDPTGRIVTRQQVLDETFSSDDRKIDSMVIDDVKVRILGTVAVATGRTSATGSYRGQAVSVVLRFTDVLRLRDGRWEFVISHGTMVVP